MNPGSQRVLASLSIALSGVCAACGAERAAPLPQGVAITAGPCGRGLIVIESDYQSSNVSLRLHEIGFRPL